MNINEIIPIVRDALNLYKENEYEELEEKIRNSYIMLIEAEAESRRLKSSSIIKAIQVLDKEIILLEFEYKKTINKFQMDSIPALDDYIKKIKRKRLRLVREKNFQ